MRRTEVRVSEGRRTWLRRPAVLARAMAAIAALGAVVAVASAAGLTLTDGTVGAGSATVASCVSGTPTVVQNIDSSAKVTSVDVSGIASGCANGTVKVTVNNGTDAAVETTKAIPSGIADGATLNVALSSSVAVKDSHFVAVTLAGP